MVSRFFCAGSVGHEEEHTRYHRLFCFPTTNTSELCERIEPCRVSCRNCMLLSGQWFTHGTILAISLYSDDLESQ